MKISYQLYSEPLDTPNATIRQAGTIESPDINAAVLALSAYFRKYALEDYPNYRIGDRIYYILVGSGTLVDKGSFVL